MSDPPQTDSPSAPKKDWLNRSKAWFDRKTDRVKNALKIGAPTTRTPSRAAFAASTTDIVLGQSASNQQDTLLRPSPTHLRPVQSFQDLTAYDATHESHVQIVPAPELDPLFDDVDATPAPADVSDIQSPGEAPSDGSGLQTATKPGSASPPLDSEETIPGLIDDPSPSPSGVKNVLKRSWDFTQTLLMKLPDVVDENPVKVALGLVKLVSEIKEAVGDNMDKTDQHIASAIGQLAILKDEQVAKWRSDGPEVPRLDEFMRTLEGELGKLRRLKSEYVLEKIASHEAEKSEIAEIFDRINQARIEFELSTKIRILKEVTWLKYALVRSFLDRLEPSHRADHKYHLEDEEREKLRREPCTPGTRSPILGKLVNWAGDPSPESPDIFWLFGPAGSGKTTIAFTVARFFEGAIEADNTIVLGGNFLCSHQFEETRRTTCIIRTVVYHLARRCDGFADALSRTGNFDTVHQDVGTQFQNLLVGPWQEYRSSLGPESSSRSRFLILFDAIDELVDQGSSEFLNKLLAVINDDHLPGLKFLVTSRPEPSIVTRIKSFGRKHLIKLQDVEEEEVKRDIGIYLETNLPHFKGTSEMSSIQQFAGSLFICAATIVRLLNPQELPIGDQRAILREFFDGESGNQAADDPNDLTSKLYMQILAQAFRPFATRNSLLAPKLDVLHTILSTAEHPAPRKGVSPPSIEDADLVVSRLYSVLYFGSNKEVLTYHKSFSDFVFDKGRSREYGCDLTLHHHLLTQQCFNVMKAGLRFNIANIPSSFLLDSENSNLDHAIEQSISPGLSYTSRSWFKHLSNNPKLALQLAEAASFALYFSGSPASASTPHLYLSMLATWTQDHTLPHTWKHHFPRIPQFRSVSSESSSALMQINTPRPAYGLAMSADGTQIVCGLRDNSVRIYDSSTGGQLGVLNGHTGPVLSVAISSDMTCIVSASHDHSVRIWKASTGEELQALRGHTAKIWSVAICADGALIVSGSEDQSVRIWSMATGGQVKVLNGHTNRVTSVATVDMTRIVSGSGDQSVRIWNVSTGEEPKILEGHQAAVYSVAVSTDGTYIVSGSDDKSVRVWDTATSQQLKVLEGHTNFVRSVGFFPDTLHVASTSHDQTVHIWDLSTGNTLKVLKGHTSWVRSVAISGDGTRIASGSGDNTVRVWDVSGLKELGAQGGHTSHAVFSPPAADRMHIVSGSGNTSTPALGPDALASKKMEVLKGHNGSVHSVAVSHGGEHIISGGEDASICIWETSTSKQLKVLEGHSKGVLSVAISVDGRHIVSGLRDGLVRVWEGLTGQERMVLQGHTGEVNSVAISIDGTHIISGSDDKSICVWDASTGRELKVLRGHTNWVCSVTIFANRSHIVSGSTDGSVRIWDISRGDKTRVLQGHTSGVRSVAVSADMKHIVSGGMDHSIRIWDVLTGQEVHCLRGHTNIITSVAISINGTHIVSGSEDQSIRVWDMGTGKEVSVLEGHTGRVWSVAVSSDEKCIVSGSSDGSVRLWARNPAPETSNKVDWKLRGGWVLSGDSYDRLMFVPPSSGLSSSNLIRVYPSPEYPLPTVNLEQAALGPNWHECYVPK
ncbi:WD40 repeat-like protein [Coprinellus micaceus]|uniref:WD40 repeat-like protein n=1 Tax=Coprinellus micaceus TaxID=71717 RepID=A0A4Y7SKJ4_COPMI|nr:WD40 repeat-like protein [Coprinellus micaceus]